MTRLPQDSIGIRSDADVVDLFDASAHSLPESVALSEASSALTYGELQRDSNRVASLLHASGVRVEDLVAVALPRSTAYVSAILGILRAGAAFVPVDTETPLEHARSSLQGLQIASVICSPKDEEAWRMFGHAVILEREWRSHPPTRQESPSGRDRSAADHAAAYGILTSGSTGPAKAVIIERSSLTNYARGGVQTYGLTNRDVVYHGAPIAFDWSIAEIFPSLVAGAAIAIRSERPGSAAALSRHISHSGVSVLLLPTAIWNDWAMRVLASEVGVPEALRLIAIGGEAADSKLVRRWLESGPRWITLLNTYGPSEATVEATAGVLTASSVDDEGGVSLGRNVPGVGAYLLDEDLQPVRSGVTGEIYIGGDGVARGYVGAPALTAQAFVPDPYRTGGARMYRTGDYARLGRSGDLEFVGRRDEQVKIRGVRVDLREVARAMEKHPHVSRAAVAAIASDSGLEIFSCVVPIAGAPCTPEDVLGWAIAELPPIMVPSRVRMVAQLRIGNRGKVDQDWIRSLWEQPAPNANSEDTRTTEPLTAGLVDLLETLLRRRVSLDDNFFALGGHSLLAMKLSFEIESRWGKVIDVFEIFATENIRDLAELVSDR